MIQPTRLYITVGAKEIFYVLRVSGYYVSQNGAYPRDNYLLNLGRNWQTAISKAQSYAQKYYPNIPLTIPDTKLKLENITKSKPKPKINFDDFPLPF